MVANIKLKRSSVQGKIPVDSDLQLGELAINTYDGDMFIKRNQSGAEEILKFIAHSPVDNVYYVAKNGNDNNDGTSWSKSYLTIEAAVTQAGTHNGDVVVIHIGPGEYLTNGHIDMPDNLIIHSDYRAAVIKPNTGFEQKNVFRMGSGCFLQGPLFEGWQVDDLDNPSEGFAVCFRPNALITRTPYAHKIACRSFFPFTVAPPLDRENANPLVDRGMGVCLADASVISPYSIYPNIMTWGATPVSQNGIGYCAKNGGLINAVNAISIWAHKHFMAINGGQIILSSCSTQFGDYTLIADGTRDYIQPDDIAGNLVVKDSAGLAIMDSAYLEALKDSVWDDLVTQGFYTSTDSAAEIATKRDIGTLTQSISWVLRSANPKPWEDTIRGFWFADSTGTAINVIDPGDSAAYVRAWDFMDSALAANADVDDSADTIIHNMFTALKDTIDTPTITQQPSTITAIGHTWNSIMAGVALTKIPPAFNNTTIEESILELNSGVVIASGQDDQGSALFIGGMKIDADTGELTGPPFEQSVNRIATRAALASNF